MRNALIMSYLLQDHLEIISSTRGDLEVILSLT